MPKVNTNTKSMDNTYKQMVKQKMYIQKLRNKLSLKNGEEIEQPNLLIVQGRTPDAHKYYEKKNIHNIINATNTLK